MASARIAKKQTRKAKVQWWDNQNMHILCPWCNEIHRHDFDGDYSSLHLAHCNRERNSKLRYHEYEIQFPDSYEIDKDNLRFVAGGAHVLNDNNDVPEDEADRLRAKFREPIETVIISKDTPTKKIVSVASQMVQGNTKYVREYLESSSEAEIFLHGIKSWKRPQCNTSDNKSEGISTRNNVW